MEQLLPALESGDLNFPELEVKSVFLDLEDSERALVQANLRIQPEDDSLEGAATAIFAAFPFPMVLEQGRWRWDFLSFFSGLALSDDERCPFGSSVEESAAQAEVRPLPVEVHRLEPPRLEPPPGVRTRGGSSGRGEGEASASVLLETDTPLAELLAYYRGQVLEPASVVRYEEVTEDLAVLTWTFRDDANRPGFGVLLITPAGDDRRWVRMWMAGPGVAGPVIVPEGHPTPAPVPAPARPPSP